MKSVLLTMLGIYLALMTGTAIGLIVESIVSSPTPAQVRQ